MLAHRRGVGIAVGVEYGGEVVLVEDRRHVLKDIAGHKTTCLVNIAIFHLHGQVRFIAEWTGPVEVGDDVDLHAAEIGRASPVVVEAIAEIDRAAGLVRPEPPPSVGWRFRDVA